MAEIVNISIEIPKAFEPDGKISQIEKARNSILLNGGKELQTYLMQHMQFLNATRHNKFGAPSSNHFTPSDVQEPIVGGNEVTVAITTPGLSRAYHDIVIMPKVAQALAIPMHRDAYGLSPRAYNLINPKGTKDALFFYKSKSLKGALAKSDGKSLVVMYLLRKSVHQKKDPSLMPEKSKLERTFKNGIVDAILSVLNSQ